MDTLTIAAASGIQARMESLEMLANNIANQAAAGYKSDREFYSLFTGQPALDSPSRATLPVIKRQWTDFTQGTLTPTGNSLDMAISGNGFFAVAGPSGTLYTRNGHFDMSPDGTLQTADGFAVLDPDGSPIVVNPALPLELGKDGSIEQEGAPVAELGLVEFGSPDALRKAAGTYFQADATAQPSPAKSAEVHQGKLESANFQPAEGAVRLVSVMRQFEMLQKAVQLGAEMNRKAVDEVARVSG